MPGTRAPRRSAVLASCAQLPCHHPTVIGKKDLKLHSRRHPQKGPDYRGLSPSGEGEGVWVSGRRRPDARRDGKGGVRRFGARAPGCSPRRRLMRAPAPQRTSSSGSRCSACVKSGGLGRTRRVAGVWLLCSLPPARAGSGRSRCCAAARRVRPEALKAARSPSHGVRQPAAAAEPARRCGRPSSARGCLARRSARWPGPHRRQRSRHRPGTPGRTRWVRARARGKDPLRVLRQALEVRRSMGEV